MREIRDEAFIDDLTGVYNRRFLKEYLGIEIRKYNRYYTPFTLLLLDLDNFKTVNDTKGHVEGDRALKEFVNFLKDYLRKSDILVRYGGDEFIIILPHTERNAGLIVAKRIIERLKKHDYFAGLGVGVSIGVAQYPDDGKDIDELFTRADMALFLAKKHGKGRVFFASDSNLKPRIPARIFVNRKKEMEQIHEAIDSEDYTLVLIHGDIGMGKTRLINEFFVSNKKEVIYGRGFSSNHNFPYYVVRDILKNLYQKRKSEFLDYYKELPSISRKHISRLVPGLIEGEVSQDEKEEKDVFLHSIYMFLLSFLKENLKKKPIFAIDDIQWIDEESSEFFKYAARFSPGIKIVGTHRVREGSSGYSKLHEAFKRRIYNVDLGPLQKDDVIDLIRAILGEKVRSEVIEYIYRYGGGNPYYVEEVIRALFEDGLLYTDKDEYWELSDSAYRETVFTPNAESIIKNKLRGLDTSELKILELLSVYGDTISVDTLSHLVSMGEGELYNVLDRIEQTGLLQQESYKNYMFPAGIIRDIILKEISKGKRLYYHRKVLEYFEEFVPKSEREEKSAFLAYHYMMVGDIEEAARLYRLAGDGALKVFAFRSALRYFNESYSLLPDNETLFKIAGVYYSIGEFKESLRILKELVEKEPNNYRFLLKLADVYEILNNLQESERITEFVLKDASEEEIIDTARMQLAWIRQREGRTEEAIRIYKDVIESTKKRNDERLMAKAYQELGVCYRRMSKLDEAEECYLSVLEMDYTKKNRLFYLITKFSLSSVIFNKGYVENAIEILKEVKDEFKKIGAMYYYYLSLVNLGACYASEGKTDEARKLLEMAEEYIKQMGNKYLLSYVYTNLASISYNEDDLKSAARYLEMAIEGDDEELDKLYNMLFLAVVYVKMGKLEKSSEVIKEYMKLKSGVNNKSLEVHELRRMLEIALLTDRDVAGYVEKAEDYIESNIDINEAVYLALYLALWFARSGDREKAQQYLEIATSKFPYTTNFDVFDFHELLMEIYGHLGDRVRMTKEFNLLKEELLERKNFKALEKLERKMEEFLE